MQKRQNSLRLGRIRKDRLKRKISSIEMYYVYSGVGSIISTGI